MNERRWKVGDRVVVTCESAYQGHVGIVGGVDDGHALVAFDAAPVGFGSPAWFLRHEIALAEDDDG